MTGTGAAAIQRDRKNKRPIYCPHLWSKAPQLCRPEIGPEHTSLPAASTVCRYRMCEELGDQPRGRALPPECVNCRGVGESKVRRKSSWASPTLPEYAAILPSGDHKGFEAFTANGVYL